MAQFLDTVPFSGIIRIRDMMYSVDRPFRLDQGDVSFDAPESVKAALRKGIDENRTHYVQTTGIPPLLDLLVEKMRTKNGIPVGGADEVMVTNGGIHGQYIACLALLEPGDEVLVPNPGFLSYATLAKLCGASPVTYDLDPPDWQIDVDALEKKITPKTKLLVVNSPSNPLGSVIDAETLRRIASLGVLVVSDEIYSEIWYDAPPLSMLGLGENVIVLNGLSKSHAMTGLRLGWVLATADLMKPIITAHQYIATCASVFSQALAELILDDPQWNAGWLESVRSQFRAQREAMLYAIEHELHSEVAAPAGAFYAFAAVPSCDTISFAKTLATDAAVLVIPGLAFGTRGQGFIRISYAAPVDQITAGIERIGRWLRASGL